MKIKWRSNILIFHLRDFWYCEIGKISSNNLLLHVTSLHSQTKQNLEEKKLRTIYFSFFQQIFFCYRNQELNTIRSYQIHHIPRCKLLHPWSGLQHGSPHRKSPPLGWRRKMGEGQGRELCRLPPPDPDTHSSQTQTRKPFPHLSHIIKS